eukprot:1052676_1
MSSYSCSIKYDSCWKCVNDEECEWNSVTSQCVYGCGSNGIGSDCASHGYQCPAPTSTLCWIATIAPFVIIFICLFLYGRHQAQQQNANNNNTQQGVQIAAQNPSENAQMMRLANGDIIDSNGVIYKQANAINAANNNGLAQRQQPQQIVVLKTQPYGYAHGGNENVTYQ